MHPVSTCRKKFAALSALLIVLQLAGCKSLTDSLAAGTTTKRTYPSIWINASWSGGRTGTPLDVKAVTPNNIVGSYCPATSIQLYNHTTKFPPFPLGDGLILYSNCSAFILEAAVCATAGSGGGNGSLPICAVDPRQTPSNSVEINPLSTQSPMPYGATGVNLSINVFYCAAGSSLNFGQVASAAPTDCVVN